MGAGAGVAALIEAAGVGPAAPEVALGDGCAVVGAGLAAEEHATIANVARLKATLKQVRFVFISLFYNSFVLFDAIRLKKIRGLYAWCRSTPRH